MCLGALYYTSPDRVVFVTRRDEYAQYYKDDQKYFELENFYDEFSKSWDERRMPIIHEPDARGIEVYKRWRKVNAP